MATDAVLTFLRNHNRPFSANEVQQGTGNYGKTALQKALDLLVSKDEVVEKTYGKQKVYFIKQKTETPISEIKENILITDRKINEVSIQIKEINDKIKLNSAQFGNVKQKITLEEAIDAKVKAEKNFTDIQVQLEKYKDVEMVDPKLKEKAEKEYDTLLSEYKKRKRMCMDILNAILENYPKSKKHLFDEIGIETDDDIKFTL